MSHDFLPIPGDEDEQHLPYAGFFVSLHRTTPENSALHAKLADPKLSLDELKRIRSESPAEIGVRWITEYDEETFESPSGFAIGTPPSSPSATSSSAASQEKLLMLLSRAQSR